MLATEQSVKLGVSPPFFTFRNRTNIGSFNHINRLHVAIVAHQLIVPFILQYFIYLFSLHHLISSIQPAAFVSSFIHPFFYPFVHLAIADILSFIHLSIHPSAISSATSLIAVQYRIPSNLIFPSCPNCQMQNKADNTRSSSRRASSFWLHCLQ